MAQSDDLPEPHPVEAELARLRAELERAQAERSAIQARHDAVAPTGKALAALIGQYRGVPQQRF